MRAIILTGAACVAYVSYCVYTSYSEPKKKSSRCDGINWRPEKDDISWALRQRETVVVCSYGDRLALSMLDGPLYSFHVPQVVYRFIRFRLAVVWHLTTHPDVRYVLVFSLLDLMPAINCENKPLDWRRDWCEVMCIARNYDLHRLMTERFSQ